MELLPDNWADVNAGENECWTALEDFVWGGNRTWSVCFWEKGLMPTQKLLGRKRVETRSDDWSKEIEDLLRPSVRRNSTLMLNRF